MMTFGELIDNILSHDLKLTIEKEMTQCKITLSDDGDGTKPCKEITQMLPFDHLDQRLIDCISFCKDKILES